MKPKDFADLVHGRFEDGVQLLFASPHADLELPSVQTAALQSIAFSLKRIADALSEDKE